MLILEGVSEVLLCWIFIVMISILKSWCKFRLSFSGSRMKIIIAIFFLRWLLMNQESILLFAFNLELFMMVIMMWYLKRPFIAGATLSIQIVIFCGNEFPWMLIDRLRLYSIELCPPTAILLLIASLAYYMIDVWSDFILSDHSFLATLLLWDTLKWSLILQLWSLILRLLLE